MTSVSNKANLRLTRSPISRRPVASDQQGDRFTDGLRTNGSAHLTLVPVRSASDILPEYRGMVVGDLLAYHNLGAPHRGHSEVELLIGMCMDPRLQLRIPANFAYVLRCAGANLGVLEFDVSFAIAVGGVRSVCLIGHDGCRMVDVASKREAFVSGLVDNAGWDRPRAEAHFARHASGYGLENVVDFVWYEAERLRSTYAGVTVAPLVYSLDERRLFQIADSHRSIVTDHPTVEVERGEDRPT